MGQNRGTTAGDIRDVGRHTMTKEKGAQVDAARAKVLGERAALYSGARGTRQVPAPVSQQQRPAKIHTLSSVGGGGSSARSSSASGSRLHNTTEAYRQNRGTTAGDIRVSHQDRWSNARRAT